MKCAYNAGILDEFLSCGISFDYCIGVSGGSGNLASYLAGQQGRNLRFFTQHLHSPRYFGLRSLLRTGDLFGLHYIYATLSNSTGMDPLDFHSMRDNPAEYRLVATNALTGLPEYFGKNAMKQDDYRPVMASCAIPAVCRPVMLNGVPYFDGGLSDAIPIRRAMEEGCTKLVVILSKPRGFRRKPQGMRLLYAARCRRYPKIVSLIDNRHIAYQRNLEEVYAAERAGNAFVFAPSRTVRAGTYTVKEETGWEFYRLGQADFAARREELLRFLG